MSKIYKILGYEHKKGEFNGRAYDNIVFYVGIDIDGEPDQAGGIRQTDKVKCSWKKYENEFLPDYIGKPVQVVYDRYGNGIDFIWQDDDILTL